MSRSEKRHPRKSKIEHIRLTKMDLRCKIRRTPLEWRLLIVGRPALSEGQNIARLHVIIAYSSEMNIYTHHYIYMTARELTSLEVSVIVRYEVTLESIPPKADAPDVHRSFLEQI